MASGADVGGNGVAVGSVRMGKSVEKQTSVGGSQLPRTKHQTLKSVAYRDKRRKL
jgi:hypothetical protein